LKVVQKAQKKDVMPEFRRGGYRASSDFDFLKERLWTPARNMRE
jgi:hypothetical protein